MDSELTSPLINVIILGTIVGVVSVFVLIEWIKRKKLKAIAKAFNGKVSHMLLSSIVRFDNNGVEVSVQTKPRQTKYSPKYLIIEQREPLGFKMTIDPEGKILSKKFRIDMLKTVPMHSPDFESQYKVRASDIAKAEFFFKDPKKREAVIVFFQNGFDEVIADKKKLTLKKPNYQAIDLDPERLRPVIEYLKEFQGVGEMILQGNMPITPS